jgi:hypothetical protein
LITTAPAPTIAPSPMVTPGTTVTAAPSQTFAADVDRGGGHVGAAVRVDVVVQGGQRAAVSDEGAVADGDASGVLEAAAEVDEDAVAQGEVLAELAVKWREDDDGVVDRLAGELGEQGAELVGRAVSVVDLGGDAECFLGGVVHEPVLLGATLDGRTAVHVGRKSCSSIVVTVPRRSR